MENSSVINKISDINPWRTDSAHRFKLLPRTQVKLLLDESRLIDILVGARRVGKTSILRSVIDELLDRNIPPQQIIYITSEVNLGDSAVIAEIISDIHSTFGLKKNERLYLILDEVQDISNWQLAVKYLYDNLNVKIFITGSSSLILKEQTNKLTGRFRLTEVLPLSFDEYILFTKSKLAKTTKNKSDLVESYLRSGGYPEYLITKEQGELNRIIESTLYRDLLSHYGIRNPRLLRDLLDYLAEKVGVPVSPHLIMKDLKINQDTARFYLSYLQDVYLIFPLSKKGSSHRVTKGSAPKYYFNDTGVLFERSLTAKIGQLAENAVYLALRRKFSDREYLQLYYDQNQATEIDFVDRAGKKWEVKYRTNLTEEDIIKYSEVKELTMILRETEQDNAVLLSYPDIQTETLYDFLLS
jgi:predicted AAA+ superfamily ATPase